MTDVVERARYAIEWGSGDQLHRDLLAEVERLRFDADFFTRQLQDALDPGGGDEWDADDVIAIVRDLEAEVERLRQQRTITTVAELDALPVGAVIRTHAVVYAAEPRPGIQANAWVAIDDRYRHCSDEIVLPATLLWLPEWGNA